MFSSERCLDYNESNMVRDALLQDAQSPATHASLDEEVIY